MCSYCDLVVSSCAVLEIQQSSRKPKGSGKSGKRGTHVITQEQTRVSFHCKGCLGSEEWKLPKRAGGKWRSSWSWEESLGNLLLLRTVSWDNCHSSMFLQSPVNLWNIQTCQALSSQQMSSIQAFLCGFLLFVLGFFVRGNSCPGITFSSTLPLLSYKESCNE